MKGQELSEAYASADVFVMPSETETLGFVVLEAMASGVPVVAVAAGGLTDIVTHNTTGGVGSATALASSHCFLVPICFSPPTQQLGWWRLLGRAGDRGGPL